MNKTIEILLNRGSLRTYKNEKHLNIILQCAMRVAQSLGMGTFYIGDIMEKLE